MRILFIGDIMGRSGRDAVTKYVPDLRRSLSLDVVIANGENATHGKGILAKNAQEIYETGVDCITSGNHIWDQKETLLTIDRDPKMLRPLNFPMGTPGKGSYIHTTQDGRKILILNAMGRTYMDALDDPFAGTVEVLKTHVLGRSIQAIFVDFHAQATSEKMAFAHYLDGKVSAVVGTHTHIPTADYHILNGGTAYQSDAGMTGDYDSVIGMQKDVPILRFVKKLPIDKFTPAEGEGTLCATFIETDDKTGLAKRIEPLRLGGRLAQAMPV